MEYRDAADFLFGLRRFNPTPGTASTADLCSRLGNPQADLRAIQIAGSNGKGSTARMAESILRAAGLDVGLYTSPHFDDVRERIRVNGRPMTEAAVADFVAEMQPAITQRAAGNNAPTFFEVVTAMALWEFDRRDVDVAVLEVGIGGPYDATSVVTPVASAVTTVTLEHTDLLGSTREAIARDKARVAPAEGPLVTGTTGRVRESVREQAGSIVTVGEDPGDDVSVTYHGRNGTATADVSIAGSDWAVDTALPLLGRHQARNAGVAATLCRQVEAVDEATIAAGLQRATWPGRFEIMQRTPLVVLDGAHNPGACRMVTETLADFEYESLSLVIGSMHDKDHGGNAAALPDPDRVVTCRAVHPRAEDPSVLAAVYENQGVETVSTANSVSAAIETAIDDLGPDDCLLVCGSLYTVAAARNRWANGRIPKRVESVADGRRVIDGVNADERTVERMAGNAAHAVVKTRLFEPVAGDLLEEFRSLGGRCVASRLADHRQEPYDVLLMGSRSAFERLTAALRSDRWGLSGLAGDIDRAVATDRSTTRDHLPASPSIMGILNVTPDSFFDGGRYEGVEAAVDRARAMAETGASIIDVGGESTRPNADPVDPETERDRVVPVIERIADLDVAISIDTRKPAVARAALEAGATMVNDVTGLEDPAMRSLVAEWDVPAVVMHSLDAPVVPDRAIEYDDVVEDVIHALGERILLAERAGIDRSNLIVDPGIGFGKSEPENFALLDRINEFRALGCPILVGHSHKSMFGMIGREPGDRRSATVAGTALAVDRGADIIRVHDVDENLAALETVVAARTGGRSEN